MNPMGSTYVEYGTGNERICRLIQFNPGALKNVGAVRSNTGPDQL